jgi:glycosyltransferase involved in cell wall biosynthesis
VRIALLCHYFAPEPGAPQARLLEMARAWVRRGHEVTVITGFPNHPTGRLAPADRGRLFRVDRMEGVRVHRSRLYVTPNRGVLRKTLGHLSFMASAALVGGPRVRRPEVLVASSPTFFSVLSAWALSRLWRRPLVFEVRDLWPAIFTELGVLTDPRTIRMLERLEMFLYRSSAAVVTVTEGFRENIVGRGIDGGKVHTITNGVDTSFYGPCPDREAAKERLGLAGRFVVLYLGAHGISHALGRILEVADRWRNRPDVLFLLVGEGAEKAELVRRAEEAGLPNVEFRPAVPKEEVPSYYGAADAGLVPLRDVPLFRTFIPSKLFELLGSGVPVVGSVAGEAREILGRSGGALTTDPEDVEGLDAALRRLHGDAGLCERLARNGSAFVRAHYDRDRLAERYLELMRGVASGAAR